MLISNIFENTNLNNHLYTCKTDIKWHRFITMRKSICILPKLWLTGERVVGDSSAGDPKTKEFNLINMTVFPKSYYKIIKFTVSRCEELYKIQMIYNLRIQNIFYSFT